MNQKRKPKLDKPSVKTRSPRKEKTGALLNFDDVLARTVKPHLLLGNGFSISYDPKRFSFTTLLESAVKSGVISKDGEIYKIFEKLETSDFENVMRALKSAEKILEVYKGDKKIRAQMQKDADNLKGYLVKIITNNHPEKSTSLTDLEKNSCLAFIAPFENIYTLNYDLLLYWSTMNNQSVAFDGFGNTEDSVNEGYVVYKNAGSFRIHYLHGAMHYFDADSEIIKKTFNNTDIPLVEQVRASLNEDKYPIFVSEGSSEQKMTKILHSAYLNHCFKSFNKIGSGGKKGLVGDLVIFGASLKSNDEHILKSILNNNIQNIYLGVSSVSGGDYIAGVLDKHNLSVPVEKKKNLYLYDYKTVNIWGRKTKTPKSNNLNIINKFRIQLLWENDHWDVPLNGILKLDKGKVCFFKRAYHPTDPEEGLITYEDKEYNRYDIFELTQEEIEYQLKSHNDFKKYVGSHSDIIDNDPNSLKENSHLVKPLKEHKKFYDKYPASEQKTYEDNKYVGSFYMDKNGIK